jgi:hypothetical protein
VCACVCFDLLQNPGYVPEQVAVINERVCVGQADAASGSERALLMAATIRPGIQHDRCVACHTQPGTAEDDLYDPFTDSLDWSSLT